MSPQTGPGLEGAGYPISRPLLALLGGTTNSVQPNVPVCTNLDFGFGALQDVAGPGSAASGSVYSVPVPVLPGTIVSKISFVVGATGAASTNNSYLWGALYTGTGSAPGTTGAQPGLIAQTTSTACVAVAANSLLTFTLATPQVITAVQAPYGYIYASYSITNVTGSGSPATYGPSLISMTAAASTTKLWTATSPFSAFMSSNGAAGSTAPTSIGTATITANPPVVLLY